MRINLFERMKKMSTTQKIAASLILKDAVGCAIYTCTARANKNYSPEKRSDVANYDLANGIINIGLQIAAIKPIETYLEKLFDKYLMPHFYRDYKTLLLKKPASFMTDTNKHVKGATAIAGTVLCQYFIKRFISPYFSMPAAEKFQQWGLVKPKLYPGETYGKESFNDRFLFYLNRVISPDTNKIKPLDQFIKENNKK